VVPEEKRIRSHGTPTHSDSWVGKEAEWSIKKYKSNRGMPGFLAANRGRQEGKTASDVEEKTRLEKKTAQTPESKKLREIKETSQGKKKKRERYVTLKAETQKANGSNG